jgi:hypothetical protein
MKRVALWIVVAGLFVPGVVWAQASSGGRTLSMEEEDPLSVAMGMGFTASPEAFLLGFEVDYRLAEGFSVGGTLQLGIEDDFTIVSPTGHLRYTFDLSGGGSDISRVRPFIQTGLGLTVIHINDTPPGVDDDDTGFMMNFGFGTELVLTDAVSVGSKMLFNFMPDDVFNESFYYSWEIATIRVRF